MNPKTTSVKNTFDVLLFFRLTCSGANKGIQNLVLKWMKSARHFEHVTRNRPINRTTKRQQHNVKCSIVVREYRDDVRSACERSVARRNSCRRLPTHREGEEYLRKAIELRRLHTGKCKELGRARREDAVVSGASGGSARWGERRSALVGQCCQREGPNVTKDYWMSEPRNSTRFVLFVYSETVQRMMLNIWGGFKSMKWTPGETYQINPFSDIERNLI